MNDQPKPRRNSSDSHFVFAKIKDPGSAITHFIAMVMAALAALPLLHKASRVSDGTHLTSLAIFIASMVLLYGASTIYHTFNVSKPVNRILKKIDHMMIFVLIAGSYTPICLIILERRVGLPLLIMIWGMAAVGMLVKAFWVFCPRWVSSTIYIGMGWSCVLAFTQLVRAMPFAAFLWLLAGGVIYTIGGIVYALKLPLFNQRHSSFGTHEIFHLFVMGGSVCHFILMYGFVA